MPDRTRRRAPAAAATWIRQELDAVRTAGDPWPQLQRAHIVSQPWAGLHTRVHAAMLTAAVRQRDWKETGGQVIRLLVAGSGSLAGRFPAGNTGRTTMRLMQTAPIEAELAELIAQLSADNPSR